MNNSIDKQRTTFFLTFLNPEKYDTTMDSIRETLEDNFKGLSYYVISLEEAPTTGVKHIHLFFVTSKVRWSTVQKRFPHAHIESEVKGTPLQNKEYILKENDTLSDDKKKSIIDSMEWGTLPTEQTLDKRNILEEAEKLLDDGLHPNEIYQRSILFRKYESLINKEFYSRRIAETPPLREVSIFWHTGKSGSGKSYTYVKLVEKYGIDNVFISADYSNKGTSLMDGYMAEKCVVLDEYKGELPYRMLLNLMEGYRLQIHCRYNNVYALYSELHITSIFSPEEAFKHMVGEDEQSTDPIKQLLRRITTIVYHYKDEDGNYCEYELDGSKYTNYEELVKLALGDKETKPDFIPIDDEKLPFED